MIEPFYFGLGIFLLLLLLSGLTMLLSRLYRRTRARRARQPDGSQPRDTENKVSLYSARPHFSYDPELLPLSGSKPADPDHGTEITGLSYLTRLPGNQLSIALEQEFYHTHSKK